MKHAVKNLIFTLVGAAFTSSALATDLTWSDGAILTLAEGDTLTVSGGTMSSGSISGTAGTVRFTGKTSLTYNATNTPNANVFREFTGTIVIGADALVECLNPKWTENYSPFGAAKLQFEGGCIQGFYQGNNVKTFNAIDVPENCTGVISNTWAVNLSGCNLVLDKPLTGAGTLNIVGDSRWTKLEADNSGFSGTFIYLGKSNSQHANFQFGKAISGSAAAFWHLEANRPIMNYAQVGETLYLGAVQIANSEALWFDKTSVLEVGARSDIDSLIDVPLTGALATVKKVGTGKLTFGTNVTTVDGLKIVVSNGTLEVNGDLSLARVSVLSNAVLTGTGKVRVVELEPGAKVTGGVSVVFAGDQKTLMYRMDQVPFDDGFTGNVVITNGTRLNWDGGVSGSAITENMNTSIVGRNGTLVMAGGYLRGFWRSNNQALYGKLEMIAGTYSAISNEAAFSWNGVNLAVNSSLIGSGSLNIHNKDRWLKFNGDNHAFAGEISITGATHDADKVTTDDSNGTYFTTATAGSAKASWTHLRKSWLRFEHAANTTLAFGDLNVGPDTMRINVKETGTTVEIGGRNGESLVDAPFTGSAFTLKKTGIGKLSFGENIAFVSGTTFAIDVAAADVDLTALFADTTKVYELVMVPSGYSTTSAALPATYSSTKGSWKVTASANADGSTTYHLRWSPKGMIIVFK